MCHSNKTQLDNDKNIKIVMPMHNFLEYSNNYSKTSESLFQCYRDGTALNDAGTIVNFTNDNASDSVKLYEKIISQTDDDDTKNGTIKISK